MAPRSSNRAVYDIRAELVYISLEKNKSAASVKSMRPEFDDIEASTF